MELNLQSIAPECDATHVPFAQGDRIISALVQLPDGDVRRVDLLESTEPAYEWPGELLCRWTVVFEPEPPAENLEQTMRLTAANLFFELTAVGEDLPVENSALVQFLALMLERKRVLRPKGLSDDGRWKLFEHGPEKTLHRVPVGEISSESLLAIRDQLEAVLGVTPTSG